MGKTGAHAAYGLDIGSATENCLRGAGCNVLISSREFVPGAHDEKKPFTWTEEAMAILEKIPPFARGLAKVMVEEAAEKEGIGLITPDFMHGVRKGMGW